MARLAALDWDRLDVRLVVANVQGNSVTVEDAVSVRHGDDIAKAILDLAKSKRLKSVDCLVAMERSAVEIRSVEIPVVPTDEMPDIVRMQAMREFNDLSDDWPVDFLANPPGAEGQDVLAAAASPAKVKQIASRLEAAELKLKSLVLRPTATMTLLSKSLPQLTGCILIVDILPTTLELTVLNGNSLLLSRSVPLEGVAVKAIVTQIRRTMMAAGNQAQVTIDHIVITGKSSDYPALAAELQQDFHQSVDFLDPFAATDVKIDTDSTVGLSGPFAATIGMLLHTSQPLEQNRILDFVNPRQRTVPPSRKGLYTILAVAAGIALLAGLAALWWETSRLDKQIAERTQQSKNLDKAVELAEQQIQNLNVVKEWTRGEINWLSELETLSTELPPAEQLKLERLQLQVKPTGDAEVVLEGLMKDESTVAVIEDKMSGDERTVSGTGAERKNKDADYPVSFKETVSISTASRAPKTNVALPGKQIRTFRN
ncbi:MAG: hypothetical protein R3C28_20620 [Pirellulaceae bacterium]